MRTRDINKEAIIREKAIQMIVDHGFDGLSMHKLARAAGVSVATIYIYFKDREDLIMQLFTEESKKMARATLYNFNTEAHFDEGLKIQWFNRMRYCIENQYSMAFLEQVKHSPLIDRAVMDQTFLDAMSRFVTNAIKRKELICLPVEVYWSIAFAPMYQLVKYHIAGRGLGGRAPFTFDEPMIDLTLSLVLKALKPPVHE
jgi:TetR/AcrR family transcriptional repressor of multidrug resistance operon